MTSENQIILQNVICYFILFYFIIYLFIYLFIYFCPACKALNTICAKLIEESGSMFFGFLFFLVFFFFKISIERHLGIKIKLALDDEKH